MLIRVIFNDKRVGIVRNDRLESFLRQGQIIAFRRQDGWAKIGYHPIRGYGGKYSGSDRRNLPDE